MILPSQRSLEVGALLCLVSLGGAVVPLLGWGALGGILALGILTLLEGSRLPQKLVAFSRSAPKLVSVGEAEAIEDEIRNLCPFPLEVRIAQSPPESLTLEPPVSAVILVPAHGRARIPFKATAARRGELRLPPPVVRAGRPGGLALRQFLLEGESTLLRVSPNVVRLKRYEILRQSRTLSSIGLHAPRHTGLGVEFDHLRGFTSGDDLRRIHWKATARRLFPISQVVRVEKGQSVVMAVDVSHWMGISAGALSRLDYAADAALFLSHVAQKAGDQVGLILFAQEVTAFLPPSALRHQVHRILVCLSSARPQAVHPSYRNLVRHILAKRLRRSLVIVFSEPSDPETDNELQEAVSSLRPRHLPLVVGFQDPSLEEAFRTSPRDVLGLCQRLAAREVAEERAERILRGRQKGLSTLDVLPGELSVSLVNRYLELKARGAM